MGSARTVFSMNNAFFWVKVNSLNDLLSGFGASSRSDWLSLIRSLVVPVISTETSCILGSWSSMGWGSLSISVNITEFSAEGGGGVCLTLALCPSSIWMGASGVPKKWSGIEKYISILVSHGL